MGCHVDRTSKRITDHDDTQFGNDWAPTCAQGAANSAYANGGTSAFVEQLGVFISSSHPMVKLANLAGIHIDSTASPTYFIPKGGNSGYKVEYRDNKWADDQAHHFAAYFQFGYQAGAALGSFAAHLTEQFPLNPGDINLGAVAAEIGAAVSAGRMSMFDVANRISKLCQ